MKPVKIGEAFHFPGFSAVVIAYAPRGSVKCERVDGTRFFVGGFLIDHNGRACRRV